MLCVHVCTHGCSRVCVCVCACATILISDSTPSPSHPATTSPRHVWLRHRGAMRSPHTHLYSLSTRRSSVTLDGTNTVIRLMTGAVLDAPLSHLLPRSAAESSTRKSNLGMRSVTWARPRGRPLCVRGVCVCVCVCVCACACACVCVSVCVYVYGCVRGMWGWGAEHT